MDQQMKKALAKGKLIRGDKIVCTACGNSYKPIPESRDKYTCPWCENGIVKEENTIRLLIAHAHLMTIDDIAKLLNTSIGYARKWLKKREIKCKPRKRTRKA